MSRMLHTGALYAARGVTPVDESVRDDLSGDEEGGISVEGGEEDGGEVAEASAEKLV
jgi:hypothetical protein